MGAQMDRRSFLQGAAASALGVMGAGMLGACSQNREAEQPYTFADTVAWDGRYDVVVIGFGAAGAASAISAANEGANVLLLDKAPEGHEGGNTRYCGQTIAYGNKDVEGTRKYYEALFGSMPIPEDVFSVFVEGVASSADDIAPFLGLDRDEFIHLHDISPAYKIYSPEYPEFGGENVEMMPLHNGFNDGYLWRAYRQSVVGLKDRVDVWFESPAIRLLQDPETKTVVGVEVGRKGKTVNIRADNGVVLACGGFENNPEMVKDYLGMPKAAPIGTLYNTGDGIRMAQEVGADLWHMHVYETLMILGGVSYVVGEGERASFIQAGQGMNNGSLVMVGTDGYRFIREDEGNRHGHLYQNGVWQSVKYPERFFLVYDQSKLDELLEANQVPRERLDEAYSAPSITELAGLIGTKEGVLEETVSNFNSFAASGKDLSQNRSAESMRPFDDGPYYALELVPTILNTQGGPRRNANAEVVGVDGSAIPHLYSAGECGGVTSNMYQGGGNMTECLVFGRIAGRNAAAEKEPLPPVAAAPVESSIAYTIGTETDLGDAEYEAGEGEYIGKSSEGIGGEIVVKVAADGGSITAVEVLKENETPDIGGKALEKLPAMVVESQTTEIDAVAGATITSSAFLEAVDEALSQM